MAVNLLSLLGVFSSFFAVLMPLYFAKHTNSYADMDYSAVRNTLSELGSINSPYKHAVAYYYFFPLALANIVFLLSAYYLFEDSLSNRTPFILMSFVSIGYFMAAFFPSDQGSPVKGSVRNQIHNIGGVFEYIGSGSGLILLGLLPQYSLWGEEWGVYLVISGGVILIMLMLLILPFLQSIRGLIQRVAEYSYFGWIFVFSVSLLF